VYVRPFPPSSGQVQISTNGGQLPKWHADGHELFFIRSHRPRQLDGDDPEMSRRKTGAFGRDKSPRADLSALGENGSRRRTGLDPEPIVDGTSQLLLASQVAFSRLNRNVPEEELNLIEFAAGQMT
jgi:hypothetical protein